MKPQGNAGFTLIEILVTLVLIGMLSVFAGMFMTTFINGYFSVKSNSETALKAQIALHRLSLELRDISAVSQMTNNSQITYSTNTLGADRTIKYGGNNIYISTPTDHILIDNIESFTLSSAYDNVYSIASNDMAYISVGFKVRGYDAFATKIFPRTRIPHP